MSVIDTLRNKPLADHPLLKSIDGKRIDGKGIYRLLANSRGFTEAIPNLYASLILRSPCTATQSMLASQLNDELGRGKPGERHLLKMDRMLSDMADAFGALTDPDRELEPGRRWVETVRRCLQDPSYPAAVGAIAASEHRAEEFNGWLGQVMRNQSAFDLSQCDWYNEHAELESSHAADGERMLALMPEEDRQEAARGALAFDTGIFDFMDEMIMLRFEPSSS